MNNFKIHSFLEKLTQMNALSKVWLKVIDLLSSLQPDISNEALGLFALYFSQLDDGNICIPLDEKLLIQKWNHKWEGLLLVEKKLQQKEEDEKTFRKLIKEALPQINEETLPGLIGAKAKPFVIFSTEKDGSWLFAAKYFKAKVSIENRIKTLMQPKENPVSQEEIKNLQDSFLGITMTRKNKPILLNKEQAEAIIRGQKENLIITGGPGTGKTTVVCFLLWELLKNGTYFDYHIYLAAPSGKAQDRLKESLVSGLEDFIPDELQKHKKIFDKLNSIEAYTIHRLLSYNPATNNFRYNASNRFEDKSIFVIDEASMIDISLFSSLLEAIPDNARLFILGDKDQLPSVQAGAVLGELLAKKTSSVVELVMSNRFNEESQIGHLKNAMQNDKEVLPEKLLSLSSWTKWKDDKNNSFCITENENPVTTFIPETKYAERKTQIEEILEEWTKSFYENLVTDAKDLQENFSQNKLDLLWEKGNSARILCAERKGLQGVQDINENICKYIIKQKALKVSSSDEYFSGQLLLVTKNHSMFCLYNGDSGIVIEKNDLKYLMIKKEAKKDSSQSENSEMQKKGIFREGNYLFYPLHLLPKESLEAAYAITIHKSQGSGYPAILVFLPEQAGHPLLNRQIAYTAITRTKGSTYIFADYESLENARKTIIQRDTLISLN